MSATRGIEFVRTGQVAELQDRVTELQQSVKEKSIQLSMATDLAQALKEKLKSTQDHLSELHNKVGRAQDELVQVFFFSFCSFFFFFFFFLFYFFLVLCLFG